MEFIDKNNPSPYIPIYSNFENLAWNTVDGQYHCYLYNNLPKDDIKSNLIIEQKGLCCYCMGIIKNDSTTTLEHIFPQKPAISDLLENYNILCTDSRVFNYLSRNIPNSHLSNLPHDISYYNLVASCDSKSSCNNMRGNSIIKPFFFNSNIKDHFSYDENGQVFSARYFEEIKILGLSDPDLIKYRKFWKYVKKKDLDLDFHFHNSNQLKNQLKILALEFAADENDLFFLLFIEDNEIKLHRAIKYQYFYN